MDSVGEGPSTWAKAGRTWSPRRNRAVGVFISANVNESRNEMSMDGAIIISAAQCKGARKRMNSDLGIQVESPKSS